MKIVSSTEDNLHGISKPVFWENVKNSNLSSAEYVHRVVKVTVLRANSDSPTMHSVDLYARRNNVCLCSI